MNRLFRIISTTVICIALIGVMNVAASALDRTLTTKIGVVNASSLRLRSGPSSSNSTVDFAYMGEYVNVTGKSGSWYKVSYNLTQGYMHESYLLLYDRKNVELGYGEINANKVNVRSGPGTQYSAVSVSSQGDKAYIIGFNNQWYKVIYGSNIGYIRSDYVHLTQIPYENRGSSNKPKFFVGGQSTGIVPSAAALNGSSNTTANQIIATAKKYIGVPYLWGGTTPKGFDCSGFVQYVFKQHGISLNRTTAEQYKHGSYVSKSNLKPGDLVFLQNTYRQGISHVGIYIGDGKMIHASSSKGIVISDLSTSYYTKHYYGARRIL